MNTEDFALYASAIRKLEAIEDLRAMEVVEYPTLKDEFKSKRFKEKCKVAGIKQKVTSFDDIDKVFRV